MGKIKRVRQKYHLLKKQEKKEEVKGLTYEEVVNGTHEKLPLSNVGDGNIFSGINIDFDQLKTSLGPIEDDRQTVRSIAKSIKYDANGKLIKKEEKRKIRHDLFMKKLDVVRQMRLEAKKKKKHQGKREIPIVDELPQLVKIENRKMKSVKKKGIEKAKKRQKNLLDDINSFRKILSNPEFKANPIQMISNCVQKRILEDNET